jgi:hypothetical protein
MLGGFERTLYGSSVRDAVLIYVEAGSIFLLQVFFCCFLFCVLQIGYGTDVISAHMQPDQLKKRRLVYVFAGVILMFFFIVVVVFLGISVAGGDFVSHNRQAARGVGQGVFVAALVVAAIAYFLVALWLIFWLVFIIIFVVRLIQAVQDTRRQIRLMVHLREDRREDFAEKYRIFLIYSLVCILLMVILPVPCLLMRFNNALAYYILSGVLGAVFVVYLTLTAFLFRGTEMETLRLYAEETGQVNDAEEELYSDNVNVEGAVETGWDKKSINY